jgi:putative NADH-flavin reductase
MDPHAGPDSVRLKVCIVGASGKLRQYMVKHVLDRGYQVVGVCREASVGKIDAFKGRMTVIAGATDDRDVIARAVDGCDGVLTVLVARGVQGYSSGTAQTVLDHARSRSASRLLIRLAHQPRRPRRVLLETQGTS